MKRPEPLTAVYEFCQEDEVIYWEVVEELETSVIKLQETLEEGKADLEALRFIAHKMKSTFRILRDESFKEQLDAYVSAEASKDDAGKEKAKNDLLVTCHSYLEMIRAELKQRP